jgi:hypothetical protein
MIVAQPALDLVVIHEDLPVRVWFNNPAPQKAVWLIKPNGVMRLYANEAVLAMPVADAAMAAKAFAPVVK